MLVPAGLVGCCSLELGLLANDLAPRTVRDLIDVHAASRTST
ncbi:hypothetical protein [Streptomyces sp. NEAU-YJ-81]|nr:hypothetical protein [Streptomyces sp. NEAU-YJ-81]